MSGCDFKGNQFTNNCDINVNYRLGTPILLGGLLRHFREQTLESQKDSDSQKVVYFAVGICVATFVNVITLNQGLYGAFHVGGRIRAAVCSVVYRKVIRS